MFPRRWSSNKKPSPATAPKGRLETLTIAQAIRRDLSMRSLALAPSTAATWKTVAKNFQRQLPIPIYKLKAHDLSLYQLHRLKTGAKASTVANEIAIARVALRKCEAWDELRKGFTPVKANPKSPGIALTDTEITRLLAVSRSRIKWNRLADAIHVALETGLRYGEILNMQNADYDETRKLLTIRRGKTGASNRSLPVPVGTAEILQRRRALFTQPDDALFCKTGIVRNSTRRSMQTTWTTIRKAAGLEHVRFHDLRHTAITKMAEAGIPDWTLRAFAGHISDRMMSIYSHPRREALTKAADALALEPIPEHHADRTNGKEKEKP